MHQHIKQPWVDALRSGKYQQGKDFLRREGNYCCLGVLCDLYDRETSGPGWDEHCGSGGDDYLGSDTSLPGEVTRWAGLIGSSDVNHRGEYSVNLRHHGYRTYLSSINDEGASFNEIADLIEQQL